MRNINKYIIEKLHLNKDAEIEDINDFDYIIKELDEEFSKIGYKYNNDNFEKQTSSSINDNGYKYCNYYLYFKNPNNTSHIDLKFDISKPAKNNMGNLPSDKVLIYVRLFYSNGKRSFSVASKAVVSYKYELKYKSEKYNGGGLYGNHPVYELTDDVLTKVLDGIKEFKYYKDYFNEAINKSRFTAQAWNKLVNIIKEIFE